MTDTQTSNTPKIKYYGSDETGATIGSEDFNTVVPFDELDFAKWAESEGLIYCFVETGGATYVVTDIDHDGDRDEDVPTTEILSEWIDDVDDSEIIRYLLTTVPGDKFRQTFNTVCQGAYAIQTAENDGRLLLTTHQIIAA